jgi:hypothetical protein
MILLSGLIIINLLLFKNHISLFEFQVFLINLSILSFNWCSNWFLVKLFVFIITLNQERNRKIYDLFSYPIAT